MSDQSFSFEELKEILDGRIGLPAADIPTDLELTFDELGLDSLAIVEVQLAIEERYGLVITERDALVITTLRSTIDFVNRQLAQEPAV